MSVDSAADGSKSQSLTGKGLVALAIFTLLAGTSMAAGLEDFAAPDYAEDSWMDGVVDDATDDPAGTPSSRTTGRSRGPRRTSYTA